MVQLRDYISLHKYTINTSKKTRSKFLCDNGGFKTRKHLLYTQVKYIHLILMYILNRCVYKNSETENKLLYQKFFFQIKSILQSGHCWKLVQSRIIQPLFLRHIFGIAFRTTIFGKKKIFIL